MKYILLMTGKKVGVESYLAWSQKDRNAHMAVLRRIAKELTASGEFVATQGLAGPQEAKVVLGEKGGMPVTDGRSEEHTSELQSLTNLVCRLLLEKKKK